MKKTHRLLLFLLVTPFLYACSQQYSLQGRVFGTGLVEGSPNNISTITVQECPGCPVRTVQSDTFGNYQFGPFPLAQRLEPKNGAKAIKVTFTPPSSHLPVVRYFKPVYTPILQGSSRSVATLDMSVVFDSIPFDEDQDGDGLPFARDPDPNNPDADGDGIDDGAEYYGRDWVDLPSLGADPAHKDIFVEYDNFTWNDGSQRTLTPGSSLGQVINLYRQLDVDNPDGETGINVHFVFDELIDLGDDAPSPCLLINATGNPPHVGEHFSPYHKQAGFRYIRQCLSPTIFVCTGTGGENLAEDQSLIYTNYCLNTNSTRRAEIIAHEIGHSLSLRHGGGDEVENKSNYISLMMDSDLFTFSDGSNAPLEVGNETHCDYSDAEYIGRYMGSIINTLHRPAAGLVNPGSSIPRDDEHDARCQDLSDYYGSLNNPLPEHCEGGFGSYPSGPQPQPIICTLN